MSSIGDMDMKKFAIPAILVATVMVAGVFAFMPVEQASTVHTTGTMTLNDDSITAAKIANNAIGATEIANAAIDAATFAADAIDAAAVDDAIAPAVVAVVANLFDTDITGGNAVTCTSDKDFTLYVLARGGAGQTLTIFDGTNTCVHTFAVNELAHSFVLSAPAGTVYTLTGNNVAVDVNMTILTQSGAVADCLL